MNEKLENTLKEIQKTVPDSSFLMALAGLMRNPYWRKLKDETRLQILVSTYINTVFPGVLWCHPQNEGKRTPWEQYLVKYDGTRKGMPDILIFQPKVDYVGEELAFCCGVAIELKIGSRKPTESQLEVLSMLGERGWEVAVCTTFEQTISHLPSFL